MKFDNGDMIVVAENKHFELLMSYDAFPQSGTVIKFDNLDQNNLLANQTPSLSSRDTLS